jgi:hypothetical protein
MKIIKKKTGKFTLTGRIIGFRSYLQNNNKNIPEGMAEVTVRICPIGNHSKQKKSNDFTFMIEYDKVLGLVGTDLTLVCTPQLNGVPVPWIPE